MMTPPRSDQGFIRIPEVEFEAMLARAAEEGAKRALAVVGLEGKEAPSTSSVTSARCWNASGSCGGLPCKLRCG
jgi:hypothetical protein